MATLDTILLMLELDARGLRSQDVDRAMGVLQNQVNTADQAVKQLGDRVGQLGSSFASLGGTLSVALSAPLLGLGGAAVAAAGKLEQTKIGFETMLRSAEAAKDFIAELRDFAAKTPFEFPGLVNSAQRLLALGFAAKEVIPTLTAVGGAAAALGRGQEGINRITLALGQMRAKGKVSAEEMMQLAEAGIPAWKYLADAITKATGKVTDTAAAMKMASKGMIDGVGAVGALVEAMDRDFGRLMGRQSETLLGTWSNFQDRITYILTDLGDALAPTVRKWLDQVAGLGLGLGKLVEGFSKMPTEFTSLATSLGLVGVAAGPVAFGIAKLVGVVGQLGPAIAALNGPIGLAVVAIVGLATAVQLAWQRQQELEEAMAQFAEASRIRDDVVALTSGLGELHEELYMGADEAWPEYIKRLAELRAEVSSTGDLLKQVGRLTLIKGPKGEPQIVPALDPEAIKQTQKDMFGVYGDVENASKAATVVIKTQLVEQRAAWAELQKRAEEGVAPWQNLGKAAGFGLSSIKVGAVGAKDEMAALLRKTEESKASVDKLVKAAAELGAAMSWKAMASSVEAAGSSVADLTDKVDMLSTVLTVRGVLPDLLERGAHESLQEYAARLQNLVDVMNSTKEGAERTLAVNKQLSADWKKLTADVQKFQEEIKKARTEEFTKKLKEAQVQAADLTTAMKEAGQIIRLGALADLTPVTKQIKEVRQGFVAMLKEFYESRGDVPLLDDLETLGAATEGLRETLGAPFTFVDPFTGMAVTVKALVSDFDAAGNAFADLLNQGSRAAAAFGLETVLQQQQKLIELEKAYAAAVESRLHAGGQLKDIDMLRMRQTLLRDSLRLMIEQGTAGTQAFKEQWRELQNVNSALGKVNTQLQKVDNATTAWQTSFREMSQEVSTIMTDLNRDLARGIINIFKGGTNKDLDKQVADLKRAMAEEAAAWEAYQVEIANKMDAARKKYVDNLAKEEAALKKSLDQRAAEYADEQADILSTLEERRREYFDYAAEVNRSLSKVGEKYKQQLDNELAELDHNLQARAREYTEFVADANRQLTKIGEDLGEGVEDATRDINRSLADENKSYARDVEDINAGIRKAAAAGDTVQANELRRSLRRRSEDYDESTSRLRENLAEQVSDMQSAATRETAAIQEELARRRADYSDYVVEIAGLKKGAIDKNAEDQQAEEQALIDSLNQRRGELAKFESEAADQLAAARDKYNQFVADTLAAFAQTRAAAAAGLANELADLQKALDDKRLAHEKYLADTQVQLVRLEESYKGVWDRIAAAGIAALESIAEAGLRILIKGLFKKLETALKDTEFGFSSLGKAIGKIFGDLFGTAEKVKVPAIPGIPGAPKVPSAPGEVKVPSVPGEATGGLLGQITNLIPVVGAVISAITDIWSLTVQRRMEQDIGRMEVTTRGMLNQLIALQGAVNSINANVTDLFKVESDPKFWMILYEKLDTIIGRIGSGLFAGGGGGAGGTVPAIPASFPGGPGQGPVTPPVQTSLDSLRALDEAVSQAASASHDFATTATAAAADLTGAVWELFNPTEWGTDRPGVVDRYGNPIQQYRRVEPTRPLAAGQPMGYASPEDMKALLERLPGLVMPNADYFAAWQRNAEAMGRAFEAATARGQSYGSSVDEMAVATELATGALSRFTAGVINAGVRLSGAPGAGPVGTLAGDVIMGSGASQFNISIEGQFTTEAQQRQLARDIARMTDEEYRRLRLSR